MLFPMKLILTPGNGRRFAWTDRVSGFLELNSARAGVCEGGYRRFGKTFFRDVYLADTVDLWRTNAVKTEVEPSGARIVFREGDSPASLSLSLLVDEQALAVTLEGDRGDCGLLLPPRPASSAESPAWKPVGPSLPDGTSAAFCAWRSFPESLSGGEGESFGSSGIAVASARPFTLAEGEAGRVILHGASLPATWYVAFEATPEAAAEKAVRLAREDGLRDHREKVAAALSSVTAATGDARFDEALAWARFSGWMLVTDDGGARGIWAGLPWFRDNWGRDTFIALSGILLAGGHFGEARSVLTGFARHQNRDPGSPDWGRIPNRWRGPNDVIYNTADGTLWFIRAVWEYLQYAGDLSLLGEIGPAVDLALKADAERRIDEHGFLLHGDADTWMDARIRGENPWSPRGDRANDVQALWYTALRIGSRLSRMAGDEAAAAERDSLADRVRSSFRRFFWSAERNALADRLPPGPHGEWERDFTVRPNQLFALTVPSVLSPEESLLDEACSRAVLENVERELVSPFGLFSLCPDDPRFHPRHEDPDRYHKDAAYHNGTVWPWNSGPYVSAACRQGAGSLPSRAAGILRNEARMILESGCAGTLSENIHALPDSLGNPVLSGAWSQAWSVSEFVRNVHEDVLGFRPRLAENAIDLSPSFPDGITRFAASFPIGARSGEGGNGRLRLTVNRLEDGSYEAEALLDAPADFAPLAVNGRTLAPGVPVPVPISRRAGASGGAPFDSTATRSPSPLPRDPAAFVPEAWVTEPFPARELETEWCGALHRKDWLEGLILSGRQNGAGGGPLTAELEWYFDSDQFRNAYETRASFGSRWAPDETRFLLWAPTARAVELALWAEGTGGEPARVVPMTRGRGGNADGAGHTDRGTWFAAVPGDLHGVYYTFRVRAHGIVRESADPEARACGVNGKRSMVVDFSRTDPEGWSAAAAPPLASANDAVVYELHVADLTSSPSWTGPESLRRKYGGVTARNVTCGAVDPRRDGSRYPAGFDHLRDLGVTHVQFLPLFDYGSVDETLHGDPEYGLRLVGGKFNWGYDPENYSAPEGVYSSNPFDGAVRIRELKEMIREFLAAGIGVVMDVVYNHVPSAHVHALGICVPGYYFRPERFSQAGDDTASERAMFRSYMIDSLSHWLTEYKLSGFRFDLMGLHDVATMNAVAESLRKIKGDVLLYGEGWDMYRGAKTVGASMLEAKKLGGIGFFNDAFRCAVKGDAFVPREGGFLHGGARRESVKFGLVGAVYHPQVHNRAVTGTANPNPWTDRTASSVNYTEIHDNSTLYDKLVLVEPGRDEAYYALLQRTAIGLVLLAQGMPVLHAGMEFLRTKEIPRTILAQYPGLRDLYRAVEPEETAEAADNARFAPDGRAFSHNSYNLSDAINGLDWERRAANEETVAFTRRLIAIRKAHAHFRLREESEVAACLSFIEPEADLLAWRILDPTGADPWAQVCAVVNPGSEARTFALPPARNAGYWREAISSSTEPSEARLPAGSAVRIGAKALYLYAEF